MSARPPQGFCTTGISPERPKRPLQPRRAQAAWALRRERPRRLPHEGCQHHGSATPLPGKACVSSMTGKRPIRHQRAAWLTGKKEQNHETKEKPFGRILCRRHGCRRAVWRCGHGPIQLFEKDGVSVGCPDQLRLDQHQSVRALLAPRDHLVAL